MGNNNISYKEFIAKIELEAKTHDIPYIADFELTSHCNFRCKFCYVSNEFKSNRELSFDQWKFIIDNAVSFGLGKVSLTGGEAILREDYEAIYQYCYDQGIRICVLSNGYAITEKHIELYKNRMPEIVSITLYGGSDTTYESITRIPNAFEKVMKNIQSLKENGIPLQLKIIAHPEIPIREYIKIRDYCDRHKIRLNLVKYMSSMRSQEGETNLNWRLSAAEIKTIAEIVDDPAITNKSIGGVKRNKIFDCNYAHGRFAISYDGKMFGCLSYTGMYEEPLKIGFEKALLNLRNRAQQLSKEIKDCQLCEFRYRCRKCVGLFFCETGHIDHCSTYIKSFAENNLI